MEKLKRLILISCFSLVGISSAFAGNSQFFPAQKGRFNVGIDALYLRPNTDSLTYALLLNNTPNFNNDYKIIDPSYNWGFYAHVGYQFPCSCYDVDLAYTHFNSNDNDSVEANTNQTLLMIPLSSYGLFDIAFRNAASKAEFNLNAINLDVGRNIMSNTYNIRLFGGLRYANFNSDLQTIGITTSDILAHQKNTHNFRGVGPIVGAEGRYALCGGWGVDAVADMAFLIGQTESKYQAPIDPNGPDRIFHEISNSTIPVLEAKIGMDYTIHGCRNHSLLVFDGGYQTTSYLNIITNLNAIAQSDSFGTNTSGPTPNLSFNGVYLGAKYYI